jgi:hypothetical protein
MNDTITITLKRVDQDITVLVHEDITVHEALDEAGVAVTLTKREREFVIAEARSGADETGR